MLKRYMEKIKIMKVGQVTKPKRCLRIRIKREEAIKKGKVKKEQRVESD